MPRPVQAAKNTWLGTTSADWNTPANWSPSATPAGPATNDSAYFLSTAGTFSVNISASTGGLSLLQFNAGAFGYTISANPGVVTEFTVTNGINALNTSGTNTIGVPIYMNGNFKTGDPYGGNVFTQSGGGVLLYSGGFTVGNSNSLSPYTFNGSGTQVFDGPNPYNGITEIDTGTLQIGNNDTSGTLPTGTGGGVIDNGTLAFNRTDAYGGPVANVISGTGSLTVSAGTLTLGGANTYTGATNVNAGILQLGATGALGYSGSNTLRVTVSNGAALDLSGITPTANVALRLNGSASSAVGALTNSSGTAATYGGAVALQSASSIGGRATSP